MYGIPSADLQGDEFTEIYLPKVRGVFRPWEEQDALARTFHLSRFREKPKYDPQEALEMLWTPYGRGLIREADMIKWLNNAKFELPSNHPKATPKATLSEVASPPPALIAKYFSTIKGVLGVSKDSSSPESDSTPGEWQLRYWQMQVINEITDVLASGLRLVTVENSKFGMAPPDARPGDAIYLLEGCSHTVVLRCLDTPVDGRNFTIVGPSYVDSYHMKDLEPVYDRFQEISIH